MNINIDKSFWRKFYSFDTMLTPSIIQLLFWILVVISVISSLFLIFHALTFIVVIWAVIWLVLKLILAKVLCEVILVLFKINEHLMQMNNQLSALPTNTTKASTAKKSTSAKVKK